MEQDNDVGTLHDRADDCDAWENQRQLDRERETYDALEACVKAGISREHLKVLARETGMTTWALQQSLRN